MLYLFRVNLPSATPTMGSEIMARVLYQGLDKVPRTDDVPETAPINGHFLRYRWYRLLSDQKVTVCSVHPSEQATQQCLDCVKAKIPDFKSYHCSSKCYSDAWQHHFILHERARNENTNIVEESLNNAVSVKIGAETWLEVGHHKSYTPTADDIGQVLKFECAVVNVKTMLPVKTPLTAKTSHVIPTPPTCPRRIIPVGGLDASGRISSSGTFTLLSYNILAEVYASSDAFSYCPSWALSWSYRRQNLLREILGYSADIICLQEVQNDHYREFFVPEFNQRGYQAIYKRKTNEFYDGNFQKLDGCATFFRRDRFSIVEEYEVEFDKAAQFLTEPLKKNDLNRLIKDVVALTVVLEPKFSIPNLDTEGKKQLVCVANAHIFGDQDLKDVRLWQVHILLKGLEEIANSADIPMMVCGSFNSIPGSAPHHLLTRGRVEPAHPDLAVDPLNLCQPHATLTHRLHLVSAYSLPIKGVNPLTNEPLFTSCTRDFTGTLDYIFYTADTMTVESLLELLDEAGLREDTALPSPVWSSSHIALLAGFRCKSRSTRFNPSSR